MRTENTLAIWFAFAVEVSSSTVNFYMQAAMGCDAQASKFKTVGSPARLESNAWIEALLIYFIDDHAQALIFHECIFQRETPDDAAHGSEKKALRIVWG